MACGLLVFFSFHSVHLSHCSTCQYCSVLPNAKGLSPSDVVVLRGRTLEERKKREGPQIGFGATEDVNSECRRTLRDVIRNAPINKRALLCACRPACVPAFCACER